MMQHPQVAHSQVHDYQDACVGTRTELDQVESEHQHQRLLGQRVGHHIGLYEAFAFFDLKLGKDTCTFTACR